MIVGLLILIVLILLFGAENILGIIFLGVVLVVALIAGALLYWGALEMLGEDGVKTAAVLLILIGLGIWVFFEQHREYQIAKEWRDKYGPANEKIKKKEVLSRFERTAESVGRRMNKIGRWMYKIWWGF